MGRISIAAAFLGLLCVQHIHGRSLNQVMKGDVSTLFTSSENVYGNFWMEMLERDFLVFSVKTCSDAHVVLTQLADGLEGHVTEVVISGWTNTLSCIRRGLQGEWYTSAYTPEMLHCSEYRTFWISWADRHVRVGKGPIPGEQQFMDAPGTENIAKIIRGVSFSTGFGYTGVWQIKENQGYLLGVRTPDDFRYQFMWKSVEHKGQFLTFMASGCSDAHINLSPELGKIHYEVVIGGWENKISVIRINNGAWLATRHEDGVLDCENARAFWISWFGGVIRVGKGDIHNREILMEYTDNSPVPVNYYSVASGYGAEVRWFFNDDLENRFRYFTSSENKTIPDFDMFALTPSEDFITFDVTACADFTMALSPLPGEVGDYSWMVFVGSSQNSKSGIYQGFSPMPLVSVDTPGILHCERSNPLWLSWKNDMIRFGRGNVEGIVEVFRYNISAGLRVNSIGFGNNHEKGGQVKLNKNAGGAQLMRVRNSVTWDNAWVSVVEDFWTTFSVRACRDVNIAMSAVEGVISENTYTVILGYQGYRTVVMDRYGGGASEIAAAETPEIVSCTEFRYFWLSWLDGIIRVGKGEKWGQQQILELVSPKPHPVNALSLNTNGSEAFFEFEADREDFSILHLMDDEITMKWFAFSDYYEGTWFYVGVNEGPIRITLSDRYMDDYHAYHVFLGSDKNTVHKILKGTQEVARTIDPELISMTERSHIWISWENGLIEVGKSKFKGFMTKMSYQDNSPYVVRAMAASGIDGSKPELKVWNKHITEVAYDTSMDGGFTQFQMSARHKTHVKFEVAACDWAEVSMCSYLHSNAERYCYRVVIQGERNMTSIYRVHWRTQHQMISVPTTDLLKCGEWRRFWLSWHDNHIALGRGSDLGLNGVIAYQDINGYPVHALAISTNGTTGRWRFPRDRVFEEIPEAAHRAINGAQIAGVVVGCLVLIILFACIVDAVQKPPPQLERYLVEPEKRKHGGHKSPQSFENPLAGSYD